MSKILLPKDLQKIGQELAIKWDDGTETYIPLEKLRRSCPCALCKGEPEDVLGRYQGSPTEQQLPLSSASFELLSWEKIGSYGFQPKWGDGHASGIFTWENLINL